MKLLVSLCVLSLVGLALTESAETTAETTAETQLPDLYPRGCVYIEGRCYSECEEGTHGYDTGCGHLTPEATCDNPNPTEDSDGGDICDYSACYCDSPTVRDTNTDKCVPLDQCPKKDKTG